MVRASSVISVSIIGDAKKLTGALSSADQATGGLLKSAGKVLLAGKVINEGFDFVQDALGESDRLGDAMARLSTQLSPDTAKTLERTADNFSRIGASTQDMLELEAIFTDFGTAAGIADPTIAGMAESVAATAQALTQTDDQGRDASAMLDLLDKAAGGSAKAAKELGVSLTEGLSPADQMRSILAQLEPKLVDATTGTQDLASKQDELGAKFETVMGKIGQGLEGPLTGILQFIDDEIDAIPGAIDGWEMLGAAVEGFGRTALAPLGNVRDALEGLGDLIGDVAFNLTHIGQNVPNDRQVTQAAQREAERNGLDWSQGRP